jgi:integrase
LSDSELTAVFLASDKLPVPWAQLVKLLILTGARLREWLESQTSEIDLNAATLTIPASRHKGKFAHIIPLTPYALDIISSLPRYTAGNYLFSAPANFGRKPATGVWYAAQNLKKYAEELHGNSLPPYTWHDFRRTCRTGLSITGSSPFIAEQVIGHVQKGVHAVYDRFSYTQQRREALLKWEAHVQSLISPEPVNPNVVPIRRQG